jgi:predicted PurR-regulated permease PerM
MILNSTSIAKKLVILAFLIGFLVIAKSFLMPLAIGGILAMLFLPMCKWFESKKIHRAISALLCVFILLAITGSVVSFLGWEISNLTTDLSLVKQRIIDAIDNAQEYIFNHLGISFEKQSRILANEQPSITGIMQRTGGFLARLVTNLVFTLAYVVLLLYYRIHIYQFILKLTAHEQREQMAKVISSVTRISQQYLLGLSKMIVCLWIMYTIGFSALGVKNAFFFAILCGLLEIVPFIGNITGTTLTVLAAAVQGSSLPVLGGIVITYGVVQFIQGWLLEPLIVGRQVKINPLFTIIALVLGELIWGIPGIFLAIPITAMVKTVCDHLVVLKPYGFLLGEVNSQMHASAILKKIKR